MSMCCSHDNNDNDTSELTHKIDGDTANIDLNSQSASRDDPEDDDQGDDTTTVPSPHGATERESNCKTAVCPSS